MRLYRSSSGCHRGPPTALPTRHSRQRKPPHQLRFHLACVWKRWPTWLKACARQRVYGAREFMSNNSSSRRCTLRPPEVNEPLFKTRPASLSPTTANGHRSGIQHAPCVLLSRGRTGALERVQLARRPIPRRRPTVLIWLDRWLACCCTDSHPSAPHGKLPFWDADEVW